MIILTMKIGPNLNHLTPFLKISPAENDKNKTGISITHLLISYIYNI